MFLSISILLIFYKIGKSVPLLPLQILVKTNYYIAEKQCII